MTPGSVNVDLTTVLVALITAVASYFTGKRVGRSVHRTGDYKSKPLYERTGDYGEDEHK